MHFPEFVHCLHHCTNAWLTTACALLLCVRISVIHIWYIVIHGKVLSFYKMQMWNEVRLNGTSILKSHYYMKCN